MSEIQHERIKTFCDSLKILAVPEVYSNLADVAAQAKSSYVDYLEAVLGVNTICAKAGHGKPWHDLAGFPSIKTLDDYDFNFATGAPRQRCWRFRSWHSCIVRRTSSFSDPAGQGRRT